jgi:hypothetical protein
LVLHHLRKGSTGDLDDLMGATSLRANFRGCRIFVRMTVEEANALGVPVTEKWRYLRIADTKANYAPPPESAVWFRLASEPLGNAAGIYTDGDEIGVAVPWSAPSAFDGVALTVIERIFAKLRIEPEAGWFYATEPRAKYWAGEVIMAEAGKTRAQAAAVLTTWIANEVMNTVMTKTPSRHLVAKVVLNETKIAEMLSSVAFGVQQ